MARSRRRAAATVAAALIGLFPAAAQAGEAPSMWPPPEGPGTLFAHFGEEHVTDLDGARILPRVAAAAAAYRPVVVLTSSDKGHDGVTEVFDAWTAALAPLDSAGVPVMAAVGNHDRKAKPGFPHGVDPTGSLATYQGFFASRPYPWGDAEPPPDPAFLPRSRPAADPEGASSHYAFDYRNVRWIVLDNSCFSLTLCDLLQNPPFPNAAGDSGQLAFLSRETADAKARGMTVFVQMHMPTRDPRPGHSQPTPFPHTMGEGTAPDNDQFEVAAARAGVDGVFLGHVKGQWVYSARGVPYFTDGGAGGEVYVGPGEETGVDSGYWHGFRLVRVLPDGRLQTHAVPVFADGALQAAGPSTVARGETGEFSASGRQPTQDGPEVVLELREPDRDRPNFENLPLPAYVWTAGDATVLRPVRGAGDDARNGPDQTQSGRFEAICPGGTDVTISAGGQRSAVPVTVPSRPGAIVSRIDRRARRVRPGRSRALAVVRLRQPARIRAVLHRKGRKVAVLEHRCRRRAPLAIRWDGRRAAGPGRYRLTVRVLSDRKPVTRRFAVRLRRR